MSSNAPSETVVAHDRCSFCGFDGLRMAWAACCDKCAERHLEGCAATIAAAVRNLQEHGLAIYVVSPAVAQKCTDVAPPLADAVWKEVACALLVKSHRMRCRSLTLITKTSLGAVAAEARKRKRQSEVPPLPPRQSNRQRTAASYAAMDKSDIAGMVTTLHRVNPAASTS